jgi:Na+-transporting NADH:ubiquinone oxidoreductase subunit NqrE
MGVRREISGNHIPAAIANSAVEMILQRIFPLLLAGMGIYMPLILFHKRLENNSGNFSLQSSLNHRLPSPLPWARQGIS